MSRDLLLVLVGTEAGIVGLLFLLLLAWPAVRRVSRALRRRGRRNIVETARRLHGPGDVGELRSALARCRPGILLEALEELEDRDAAPPAVDVQALVRSSRAYRRIRRAAGSMLWWRRQAATQLLGLVARERDDRALLLSLATDPHPAVSTAALLAIRELGWASTVEPLLDLAEEERSARGRGELLRETLAHLGAEAVVPPLRRRIASTRGEHREVELLRIAGRLADPRLAPAVAERLREGGLETRVQAARTLGDLGDERAVPVLRTALEDPAWQVRAQAVRALGRLPAADAVESLARALSDPSWWVRLRAALALRHLGGAGLRALRATDPDRDPYAHEMARYVLDLEEAAVREYAR